MISESYTDPTGAFIVDPWCDPFDPTCNAGGDCDPFDINTPP